MALTPVSQSPGANLDRTDQPTFNAEVKALLLWLQNFEGDLNTLIGELNTQVVGSTYQGAWSSQSGAASVPYAVQHSGVLWVLLNNLADVTASEPSEANSDWLKAGPYDVAKVSVKELTGSGTINLDLSKYNWFHITLSGATTFVFQNPPSGGIAFTLEVIQDAGGNEYSQVFPSSVLWRQDSPYVPSSAADAIDTLEFRTRDGGTTYLGGVSGKGYE